MLDMLNFSPIAGSYQMLAGADAVASFNAANLAAAELIVIRPEGSGTRWRDDGTAATDTVGVPIADGAAEPFMGIAKTQLSVWLDTGTSLHVNYYTRNRRI